MLHLQLLVWPPIIPSKPKSFQWNSESCGCDVNEISDSVSLPTLKIHHLIHFDPTIIFSSANHLVVLK